MSKPANDAAKEKQRRNLFIVLLVLAIASGIGAYTLSSGKQPAPRPSAADTPKLTNVLTPGASIGDKEGWRADEGAKIAGLAKEVDELKKLLKLTTGSQGGAIKPSDVGALEVKQGKAVEPKMLNLPPQGTLSTPGVTQGTAISPTSAGFPPNTPNSAFNQGKLAGTAANVQSGGMVLTPPAPKSRIVRIVVDAQDLNDSTGSDRASSSLAAGTSTTTPNNGPSNEKRLPLFDASKMPLGNNPEDNNPGEKITYNNKVVKEIKTTDNYLLGGSFAEGYLLNGMDAPSGGQAQNNPVPVLIALSSNAYLPSKMRSEVKDCFVVANGYGDISSERAYIRTESISCVKNDGTAIDMPIKGYITGEDGKAGVRGRLISKQGQILANALTAGLISGLGDALKATATTTTVGALGGATQVPTPGEEAKAGFGGAFGKSMDRLAQYYINLADKTFPVIEIDARRKVTVVLSKGTFIDNRVLPKENSFTDFKNLLSFPK